MQPSSEGCGKKEPRGTTEMHCNLMNGGQLNYLGTSMKGKANFPWTLWGHLFISILSHSGLS